MVRMMLVIRVSSKGVVKVMMGWVGKKKNKAGGRGKERHRGIS
jgi:hypothetical protein